MKQRIAVFASGSGSNAEKIFSHFQNDARVEVVLLMANKQKAFALERAKKYNVPTHVFTKEEFQNSNDVLDILLTNKIDWIVLAGFLWLVPTNLVVAFPNKIVNIHPALLPKYGGKGMYGMNVHKAVVAAGEKESGMTVHFVNEKYDDGDIVFQARCQIEKKDSAEQVAEKVLALEHAHYAQVVEDLIKLNS